MEKMAFLGYLILFLAPTVFAQEKVEAPVWNAGDKWVFTNNGTIEVLSVDQNAYVVKFSDDICVIERQGFNTIIFDKATLQRIYSLEGDERNKYARGARNILNFPLTPGKQWEDAYNARPVIETLRHLSSLDYYEKSKILGWDDLTIKGGKFKALKMEVIRDHKSGGTPWMPSVEGTNLYWYSPDVKYFVKCEYDPAQVKYYTEIVNWELISFQLEK